MAIKIFYILSLFAVHIRSHEIAKPHIVLILGDDIGWDDLSLHGSDQIMTPNIDMIGIGGVILSNYYTDAQGTPTRSALNTGKYPMKIGTQGPSIGAAEDRGVPISEKLLPSYLKDLGYATHLIGKWELGKSREYYLPTKRGYDSFYGFTESSVDYYTYDHIETASNGTEFFGVNLFHNMAPVQGQQGHLTNILTEQATKVIKEHDASSPLYLHVAHAAAHIGGGLMNLQAPAEELGANAHIAHSARRLYAALITGLDKSVGKIVAALAEKNMLNNTLLIFASDNGAASIGLSRNYGSNLPLRGTKATPWEGAVRSTAVLWHPGINPKIYDGLFHVTDWLPTLISAAGGNITTKLDGIDQWDALVNDLEPPRHSAIIAVDDLNEWGAYRDGEYKIVIGNVSNTCGYYGKELYRLIRKLPHPYEKYLMNSDTAKTFADHLGITINVKDALEKRDACNLQLRKSNLNETAADTKIFCVPRMDKGCLYNVNTDPEESNDIWDERPEIVQHMTLRFRMLWNELVPRSKPIFDFRADPSLNEYIWYPWIQNDEKLPITPHEICPYPLNVTRPELKYFVDMNLEVLQQKMTVYYNSIVDTFVDSVSSLFDINAVRHEKKEFTQINY